MVAPLFFAENAKALEVGQVFRLEGDEGKHAATVRRIKIGESIQLTDGSGVRVLAKVSQVEPGALTVTITKVSEDVLPELQFVLVQALAKGDRDELAVQAATELGALEIIPWQANRSVSRWEGAKAQKGKARWQAIATEAAKQSLRVWEPKVTDALSTKELSTRIQTFDRALVLDPTAKTSITELTDLTGRVAVVVGPEGGIDLQELQALEQAGATRVHLGSGVLRTSTAGLAAISFLAGTGGLWNSGE